MAATYDEPAYEESGFDTPSETSLASDDGAGADFAEFA